MLESLFNEVSGLENWKFIEVTPAKVFFCEFCQVFKNTYFVEHLQLIASESVNIRCTFSFLTGDILERKGSV